jgi:hypothetical protein
MHYISMSLVQVQKITIKEMRFFAKFDWSAFFISMATKALCYCMQKYFVQFRRTEAPLILFQQRNVEFVGRNPEKG